MNAHNLLSLARHHRLVHENVTMRDKLDALQDRLKKQGKELREARATIARMRSGRPMEARP